MASQLPKSQHRSAATGGIEVVKDCQRTSTWVPVGGCHTLVRQRDSWPFDHIVVFNDVVDHHWTVHGVKIMVKWHRFWLNNHRKVAVFVPSPNLGLHQEIKIITGAMMGIYPWTFSLEIVSWGTVQLWCSRMNMRNPGSTSSTPTMRRGKHGLSFKNTVFTFLRGKNVENRVP